jgi:ribonuclease J
MLIRDTMLSDLQHIKNLKEAGFIYSIWNGYKKLEKTKEILDFAQSEGMRIVDFHTSGHACIKTLQRTIECSQPQKIIPIHTENPDLFAQKFKNVYIAIDGEIMSI